MTDVFTPEIEILREQFSDAAKRYPGLRCTIATWHTSSKEPVFCSSGKQTGHKDYFLPKELLYTPQALIYRWNHAPCSAEELVDPLPDDYDEDDRELMLEQYEESVSWQKKTCLARRNSEHWETEKAIERLRVLAQKMSDFKILFHDACKVKSSDTIDLAYIEMQCEFEVYEYGETNRDGDGQLLIDDDCRSLMRWLWLLPVAARHQTIAQLSKSLVGFGHYREALPIWRRNHAPYVMKLDDVFLESALFCSRLLTVSKQTARQKHKKDPARAKKTADTKNAETTADSSASENSKHQAIQKIPIRSDAVTYRHAERFQQYCIDKGLSPASANTHIKMVKRIFSLAVKRGQLEKNPFNGIPLLKVPRGLVRLVTEKEFRRILTAAQDPIWEARILLAKTSGMRRGEILNLTINDVDFAKEKIIVQPKSDTPCTWRWVVKDKDRREVPLVEKAAKLLIMLQENMPDGQPYFFLTPQRYQHLMQLKATGGLIDRVAKCPDNNFRRNWNVICGHAGVENATFHDLRATCVTEWFEQGMMPHEIQRLAGHSSIETTMKYYVGFRETMIDRARLASSAALDGESVANLLQHT